MNLGLQCISKNDLDNAYREVSSYNVVIENLCDTNEMLQA